MLRVGAEEINLPNAVRSWACKWAKGSKPFFLLSNRWEKRTIVRYVFRSLLACSKFASSCLSRSASTSPMLIFRIVFMGSLGVELEWDMWGKPLSVMGLFCAGVDLMPPAAISSVCMRTL